MAIPVSRFSELESSNDAGMLKLSVSLSCLLSLTGREWSVELSLQYRHRQITSFPEQTVCLYYFLVIAVSQHRCCHLSQPSHSSASWWDVTSSVQKLQKKLSISNDDLMTSSHRSFPKSLVEWNEQGTAVLFIALFNFRTDLNRSFVIGRYCWRFLSFVDDTYH